MPTRTQSTHERLSDACKQLAQLIARLEHEVPHKQKRGFSAGGSPSKGGHRPLAAWNTPVAMCLLDIHAGVRDLDRELQLLVNPSARPRGGSDGVTMFLVGNLPSYSAKMDHSTANRVIRQVEAWCWRARVNLGEAEPWQRLPQEPGEKPPRCPWCKHRTLRYKPYTGVVRCLNPECRDSDGNPPQGSFESRGKVSGEPELAWSDGTTGVARGQ